MSLLTFDLEKTRQRNKLNITKHLSNAFALWKGNRNYLGPIVLLFFIDFYRD